MPFIIFCIAASLITAASLPSQADDEIPLSRASLSSFPHKQHQVNLGGCTDCHGSKQPGPIDQFGATWAHKTCMGCHSENKSGPVECSGCHSEI